METLAAQPHKTEIYDRYLRTYNDATTWLAETLDGSMRTPFEYRFEGGEMLADDGSSIERILKGSISDAEHIVRRNPELGFELRRRRIEYEEHALLCDMARGDLPNTMVVVSDFPPELMTAHHDVGGYNVSRKQTMLRVFSWNGNVMTMRTQTLDGSDRTALEAIYTANGYQPHPGELLGQRMHLALSDTEQDYVTDRLMGIYDRTLSARYGGNWYAGRQESPHDTYQFVCGQGELVDRFVMAELNGGIGDRERLNIAALLMERFERMKHPEYVLSEGELVRSALQSSLDAQLLRAGAAALAAGRTFSGCGMSIGGQLSGDEQLDAAGYGNQSQDLDSDEMGPLSFKCKNGHTNRRPRGKLITQCKISSCKDSVGC